MTCLCKICGATFEANPFWHHPTGVCGDECRKKARRIVKARYKKTGKGCASYSRWCASPTKKASDKRNMQKPTAKAKAVIRAKRTLANNPHLQERKRIRDIEYGRTDKGREVNLLATARYRNTENGKMMSKVTRARRRSAEGSFTREELIEKFKQCGNKCAHCGSVDHLTADHIIPLKRGGNNFIANIQPLCKSCNSRKGARHDG